MQTTDIDFHIIVSNLDHNYISKNIDGIKFYYYRDKRNNRATNRIVAIQTSENCIGICVNDYKTRYDYRKNIQPLFVIFGNKNDPEKLKEGINYLTNILHTTGCLNLVSIGNGRLSIGKFSHHEKVFYDPLYNHESGIFYLKTIGDITKDINKLEIKLVDINRIFYETIYSLFFISDYEIFKKHAYENIMIQTTVDHTKIKKKTL